MKSFVISKRNAWKYYINIIMFSICICISIYIGFYTNQSGYELLFLMPILYSFCYILVFNKILISGPNAFYFIFIPITFLRYVVLPFFVVMSSYYGGRSLLPPTADSYKIAIILMLYELVIATIFINYMQQKQKKGLKYLIGNVANNVPKISKENHLFYWLFGITVIIIGFIYPTVFESINFIKVSQQVINSFENMSFIESFDIYGIIIFKQLAFLMVCSWAYKHYKSNKSMFYPIIASLAGFLNVSIYFGTNRSDIIISAIATIMVLNKMFGKRIRVPIYAVVLILVVMISSISAVRSGISISKNTSQLIDVTDTLQCYLGGVYNVAIALETKQMFPQASSLSVFLFDIFRPMIGINIFIKSLPIFYSNIYFNQRLWLGIDRRSQILPMIGQGNLFFGYLFSPILILSFICLSYYFAKKIIKTQNIEIYYFFILAMTRLGFMMGQNTMNMINDISMNLVLFLIIYFANRLFQKMI